MAIPLPLQSLHARLGARFGQADGYAVPLSYSTLADEHGAVRERVGILDRSDRGVIEATGRDRAAFLQGMLSSDVKGLAPGQGTVATLLDVHGKVLSLLVVHCLADRLLLETDSGLVAPTMEALERLHFVEKIELEDVGAGVGVLTVAGPLARSAVEGVLGEGLPDLRVHHHVEVTWQGLRVRVVRNEESGEAGYDLWVETSGLTALWERLSEAGATPVGREAWNVLRVEAGVVRHGVDVDASTLVLEAPLADAYSLSKGCYVGQEVVARVTYRGHVNRKIVGFCFPDDRIPRPGATVRVAGRDVGRVTSAVISPVLGRGLALGFLRREYWEPGTLVEVVDQGGGEEVGSQGYSGGPLQAEVSALPFYRRSPAAA
jgi:folate-binding protein YgfZ